MNISEMTSKSKGDVEYTMLDLDTPVTQEIVDEIAKIPGVWRVRIIK
jgi:D-3-phosphoglycerate dehydrogenase